jgi:alpha-1,6-mannosyltransferase
MAVLMLSLTAPRQSSAEREQLGSWLTIAAWPARQVWGYHVRNWHIELAAVLVLAAWGGVAWGLHKRRPPDAVFAVGCALWSVPFALWVPVFSRDAYAYVAQGTLLQRGLDPYRVPVAALGHSALLNTVDPVWRHTLTPYGPIGLRVEQLAVAVGGGDEVRALIALRLVSVLAVGVAVACVWRLSDAPRRQLLTWLMLSPLVLVHLVSGVHLDALVLASLALCAAAALRDHLCSAVALAALAGEIKATAFVVLPVLFVQAWRSGGPKRLGMALVTALAVAGAACLVYLPDPLGWVGALRTPTASWDPFTPASTAALAVSEGLHHLGVSTPQFLLAGMRILVVALGAVGAVGLLATGRRRTTVETAGALLLVVLIASPVMWAWYLTPALPFLLLSRSAKAWAVATMLGSAGLMIGLPLRVVPAQRVAVIAEGAALVAIVAHARRRGRA